MALVGGAGCPASLNCTKLAMYTLPILMKLSSAISEKPGNGIPFSKGKLSQNLSRVVLCFYTTHKYILMFIHTPSLNIITDYIMGYKLPGYPPANVCFKVYGYMSMSQAVAFLSDLKLGHYMKIPPKSMFVV